MPTIESLRAHLVDELTDLRNAEQQLIDALPKMAERASSRELRSSFKSHLAETKHHEKRVTEALTLLGETPSSKTCEAMKGLLEEGQELMDSGEEGALRDAMLITAAQKVEHYEIASYGTVRTYARVLGERGVARLLDQNLKEEKAADKKLSAIAEGSVNGRAAKEFHEQASMLQRSADWVGSTVGAAVRSVVPDRTSGRRSNSTARTRSRRGRTRSGRGSRKSAKRS
jgi:ferritin-like metal-binding protein YciE